MESHVEVDHKDAEADQCRVGDNQIPKVLLKLHGQNQNKRGGGAMGVVVVRR